MAPARKRPLRLWRKLRYLFTGAGLQSPFLAGIGNADSLVGFCPFAIISEQMS